MGDFSQRHYQAIALAFQRAKQQGNILASGDQLSGILRAQNEIVRLFQDDSRKFNTNLFERACVPDANVRKRT